MKYAAVYLDMDAHDRGLLPVDDFDDDAVGGLTASYHPCSLGGGAL